MEVAMLVLAFVALLLCSWLVGYDMGRCEGYSKGYEEGWDDRRDSCPPECWRRD